MNIAFFGSSLLSAYWNGAATYYRGIIKALAARGYRTTFYEPDAYGRHHHCDLTECDWARVVVYKTDDVDRCLEEARQADIAVKASGVGVLDDYLESAVANIDGVIRIFWDVDAPATLDRVQANTADPFRFLIPKFQAVLTYGGGDPVVRAYTALGARECVPIYNALDPATHHSAPPDTRFAGDLGFLGNRLPDREARVEEFFLKPAAMLPGRRFVLGGNGWAEKPMPPNIVYAGHVYTHEHNAFNCSALAVLNVNRESMARYGYSPATRVFEAAGAGACLLTDAFVGLEDFLEPGREVLPAISGEEVAAAIESLTPERARRLGTAARNRVLAQHTYAHRAARVDAILAGRRAALSTAALGGRAR